MVIALLILQDCERGAASHRQLHLKEQKHEPFSFFLVEAADSDLSSMKDESANDFLGFSSDLLY